MRVRTGVAFASTAVLAVAGGLWLAAAQPGDFPPGGASSPPTDTEISYTVYVRRWGHRIANAPEEFLLQAGWAVCNGIRLNADPVVRPVPLEGISVYDTYVITDAATGELCPDQRPRVADYLRGA